MKKIIFALCLLSLSACHKPAPEDAVVLAPAFEVKGSLNGEQFDFTPGIDGRYMFTNSVQLAEGTHRFETNIQGLDGGDPKLGFTLFRNQANTSAEELLLSLPNQNVNFDLNEEDQVVFLQSDGINTQWTVEGGQALGDIMIAPLSFPFTYSVIDVDESCLFGTTVTYFFPISCGPTQSLNPIYSEIENDDLILSTPVFDAGFQFYSWMINGQLFVTEPGQALNFPLDNSIEPITIVLSGLDNVGTEILLVQQDLTAFNGTDFCSWPNVSSTIGVQDNMNLAIEYTDESGTVYKSADFCGLTAPQSSNSFFDVIEVIDFDENENSQPTKKIIFNAQVELYNIANPIAEPLVLNLENASIAFAY